MSLINQKPQENWANFKSLKLVYNEKKGSKKSNFYNVTDHMHNKN